MKFTPALLATTIAVANADARWSNLRRKLSFQRVAGYRPGSQVTDHCAIDLDQAAIEAKLTLKTPEAFDAAKNIYEQGGNSKSYAEVTLSSPLTARLSKGDTIFGKNEAGNEVSGKAYQDYESGYNIIKVQYTTTDIQDTYVECQVGGMVGDSVNTKGCFAANGDLNIGGQQLAYTYEPLSDNNNGRTIQGFSTGAGAKMRLCENCPYDDFSQFYNYYGSDTYADDWISAAFKGERTDFTNGNADFSTYSLDGREQVIKKGTAYLSVFMYVIREFEDALDDCKAGCMDCNDDPVHAWDEGVCFYTGSIEGISGENDGGKLLHQLADKRCQDYMTCGPSGSERAGISKLNYDMFDLFAVGNDQLTRGNCDGARKTTALIADKMYIPMIQGAMRYAFKVDKLQGGEKEAAEGAVFAAAVLPRVHSISPAAASTIHNNLRVGADKTDFKAVKAAFESVYPQIGITCTDVGGLWNTATNDYYPDFSPCIETVSSMNTASAETESNNALAIALGCTFGALFAIMAAMVLYMRSREKQGDPVFKTSEGEIKDMN